MPSDEAVEAALNAYTLTNGDHRKSLRAAIQAAVEAEREACARLAETLKTLKAWIPTGPNGEGETEHVTIHGEAIAAAIRARKD